MRLEKGNKMKADLVLKNASVYMVDKERSWAQAIAVAGEKIIFVGSDADVGPYIESDTVVIDLEGKMVLPAFVDSHMHPIKSAYIYQFQLPIFDVTGEDQIQAYLSAIREFAEANPDFAWFIGAGYSRSVFDEVGPRKEWLDEISTERPIAMTSKDGHSMWVNSKALELAGITKDTPQPEEGVIKKDPETGEPSGLLQEPGAMKLVSSLMPEPPKEEAKKALLWLQEWLNAIGPHGLCLRMLMWQNRLNRGRSWQKNSHILISKRILSNSLQIMSLRKKRGIYWSLMRTVMMTGMELKSGMTISCERLSP
jgi:predicted amidohydrolase YtcJ